MRLYVEAAGRTVPLDVGRRTDAASVLRKLRRRRIRCDRLSVRGRPWDTQETVKHHNLQHNDTIQGLNRIKGGCLEHQLKLYMRCVHLFKVLIAFYMFCVGAGILSDQSIHRAYGSVYIFYGLVVFILSLLKPCNIALGHYGSSRHNKCALLIILLFDGFAIFVQLIIAGFFLADGQYELYGENSITGRRMDGCKGATCTEEESRKLRSDCNRVQVPEESKYSKRDCDAYWASDRTAGMRLAWLAEYSQAIRYGGDEGKKMALDDLQGKGMCCGFAPPDSCDRIENDDKYPCSGGFEFSGRDLSCEGVGRDMLKQRVKCSPKLANWYPLDKTFSDEAPCQAFADGETAAVIQNSLGCRTDWGTGLCNTWEVTPDSTGCAVYFEGLMYGKLYPNGWMLLATVGVEGMTIIIACFYCWKRKDHDVLSTAYIYEEPWDPVKEGKLHVGLQEAEAMGGGDDDF